MEALFASFDREKFSGSDVMPIYEYRCEKCENQFEMLQKITAEPLKECPECGGPVHKLVSSTSFILKGGGWYATDYAKKSSPDDAYKKDKNKNGDNKDSN